jgi:imidazolonepropionase
MRTFLLNDIGRLYTMRGGGDGPLYGTAMSRPEVLYDAAVYVRDGRIADVGPSDELTCTYGDSAPVVSANGRMVTPGLVDPHTHLVHASSREHELAQKVAGVPYLEILAQGGGILSTVRSTRSASTEQLVAQAAVSLKRMLEFGVTTVEAKSGYGLDWPTEYKQLQAVQILQAKQPVRLVSTFLGAHAVPPEYADNPDAYVDEVIAMLSKVRSEGLAEFCDVFCEQGVFSLEQSRRLLTAAKEADFRLKIHADEIEPMGGAGLAAELGATSADHLLAVSEADLPRLREAGVIPVLLPGTAWNLGKRPAPGRTMIDDWDLPVAIATDYNPGSCPTENFQLVMAFATHLMKLTPTEVFVAATRNAAHAVARGSEAGVIDVGRPADLVLWNATNPDYVCYHFGVNHVDKVWIDGNLVVERGVALWDFGV